MAASDYVKVLPDSIDRWLPRPLIALGTDGFGRSENRASLRDFFEVDYRYVVVATLARARARRARSTPAVVAAGDQGLRHQSGEEPNPGDHVVRRWPTDFKLPELGENIAAGDVLRVLVKPGDTVAKDQPVLELETDKATIEVPSSVAGRVTDVKVKAGDKVKVGQVDPDASRMAAVRRRGRRLHRRRRRRCQGQTAQRRQHAEHEPDGGRQHLEARSARPRP